MVDIISSILEAEKKSDEIISCATEEGKKIILNGDIKAEEIKNKAIDGFKARKFLELKKAETNSQELYNDILEKGKSEANEIEEKAKPNIENFANSIVDEFLSK